MTDRWLTRAMADYNRSTFRWPADKKRTRGRKYAFTPEQLSIAIRVLERQEIEHGKD